MFGSYLQYGITVWGLSVYTQTLPIYKLQNRIIRAITFRHDYESVDSAYTETNILKLYDLFKLRLISFVHSAVCTFSVPHSFDQWNGFT